MPAEQEETSVLDAGTGYISRFPWFQSSSFTKPPRRKLIFQDSVPMLELGNENREAPAHHRDLLLSAYAEEADARGLIAAIDKTFSGP